MALEIEAAFNITRPRAVTIQDNQGSTKVKYSHAFPRNVDHMKWGIVKFVRE